MAKRTASGQKHARKSEKRRLRNRQSKQVLKAAIKRLNTAAKDEAVKFLPEVQSVIDKSARRRIIHRKAANRLKSRLARELAVRA